MKRQWLNLTLVWWVRVKLDTERKFKTIAIIKMNLINNHNQNHNNEVDQNAVDQPRRSYEKVSNAKRQEVINMIEKNMSFRQVSERLNIKHENVRRIYRIYRLENRVIKSIQGKPCKMRPSENEMKDVYS